MRTGNLNVELEAFGSEVSEASGRSLDLLRTIEVTIDTLNRVSKKVNADCEYAAATVAALNRNNVKIVDAVGAEKAVDALERAQEKVQKLHQELVLSHQAAAVDTQLHPDDGVVEAFAETISATAKLHNQLNQLRWVISELIVDSDLDTSKVYSATDIKKLLVDLKR